MKLAPNLKKILDPALIQLLIIASIWTKQVIDLTNESEIIIQLSPKP